MEATVLNSEVQISSRFELPMGATMKVTAEEAEGSRLVGEGAEMWKIGADGNRALVARMGGSPPEWKIEL